MGRSMLLAYEGNTSLEKGGPAEYLGSQGQGF